MLPLVVRGARPGRWAALLGVVLAGSVLGGPAGSSPVSGATYAEADAAAGSLGTDTLDPPTGLTATGGSSAVLAWAPAVDSYPSGYHLYRATASGGPYALIGSATPRIAASYTDSPLAGTYWYEVRTFHQAWESIDAGPVSATVGPVSTGYKACDGASNVADTSGAGDDNGYETTPDRACASDSILANDTSSGTGGTASCGSGAVPNVRKDRHRWWGFSFGLPASLTSVNGIQVQAALRLNATGGTTNLCAQLSWNGGTTWTTIKSLAVTGGTTLTTYTFGTTSDTWGRVWAVGELSTTNFRVRIIDASGSVTKSFLLDYLSAQVTYAP